MVGRKKTEDTTTREASAVPGEVKPVPKIFWQAEGNTQRKIEVLYQGYNRAWIAHWGDGVRYETMQPGAYGYHTYDKAGAYTITIREAGYGKVLDRAQVIVQDGWEPVVEWGPAPDNNAIYQCRFGDPGNGIVPRIWIDWGDGKQDAQQEYWGTPGTVAERALEPGTYPITIKDLGTTLFDWAEHTIEGITFDPDFTVTEDTTDTERMTAKVKLTKTSTKALTLNWGDKNTTKVASPTVGAEFTHKYKFPSDFLVKASYDDGSGTERGEFVTVPYTA